MRRDAAALRREGGARPGRENKDAGLDTLLRLVGVLLGGEPDDTYSLQDFGRSLGASVRDIPPGLLLAGRAIGLLDGITRQLDPDLDAMGIVTRYTGGP